MTTSRRWLIVAAGLVVLLCVPFAVGHRPVARSDVGAADLLHRILASKDKPYSGYAESQGSLQLPVSNDYNSIADLVGGRTQLRVWWRANTDWRVDSVSPFGETDTSRDDVGLWTWEYERQQATRTAVDGSQPVRLPATSDLLPPELGRRLLSGATTAEVTLRPTKRIAGVDAPGLRLTPSSSASSVGAVDVWADPSTGLPLRVAVTAKGASIAAVTSGFLSFSSGTPSAADTRFTPHDDIRLTNQLDIATAIDRYATVRPPSSLGGLDRSASVDGLSAIGIYGRGVTELVAVPLRGRFADPLRKQLSSTVAPDSDGSVALGLGPLNVRLTPQLSDGRAWLLTGSVTPSTLATAAGELAANPPPNR